MEAWYLTKEYLWAYSLIGWLVAVWVFSPPREGDRR